MGFKAILATLLVIGSTAFAGNEGGGGKAGRDHDAHMYPRCEVAPLPRDVGPSPRDRQSPASRAWAPRLARWVGRPSPH